MLARVLVFVCLAMAGPAWAQTCHLPPDSHEARLLAFFEAPLAFSTATGPEQHEPLTVRLGVEVSPLPSPDSSLRETGVCYLAKGEHTSLAPVFPRPRITVWLPFGFAAEASYDPPIPIGQANVDIGSLALAYTHRIVSLPGADLALGLRAQGTLGHITGPITCPQSALQLTDTSGACYGTKPSKDAFNPAMFGVEGSLGASFLSGHLATYVGGGLSRLYPTLNVGFHPVSSPGYPTVGLGYGYATPYLPHLVVDLTRGTVFGGVVWHVTRAFDVNTQVYSVPNVTTFRFGAGYRIGT